jgi:hypothetical protein
MRKELSMTRAALVVLFLLLLLAPATAHAARATRSIGPEIGFSADPDQVVFGGHLCFANVAPDLDFVPSVDVGLGDDVTVTALNGDFHYRFKVSGATWQPYAGAGVSFYGISGSGPFGGGSSSIGGGNLIVGTDVPTHGGSRFFAELRLALGDGPSFRLIGGWNFPMR